MTLTVNSLTLINGKAVHTVCGHRTFTIHSISCNARINNLNEVAQPDHMNVQYDEHLLHRQGVTLVLLLFPFLESSFGFNNSFFIAGLDVKFYMPIYGL